MVSPSPPLAVCKHACKYQSITLRAVSASPIRTHINMSANFLLIPHNIIIFVLL